MSWEIVSFVVLGLALVAGFAWYERSRPPARVLALVAALASLAVVGRVAFAAVPNVQATTDIVLLSGYALGGAPGFCVGAVTALVSNVFFGHGPWTPWQMAAWGGVGMAGAGLAWLVRGRQLGRLSLASACAVAGLAFGAVMDVFVWTLGAEQTLAHYLTVAGTSLPFNLAHAAGNFALCLLVGPPLVAALRRYRRRAEVRWAPRASGVAAAGADAVAAGRAAPGRAPLAAIAVALLAAGSLALPAAATAGNGEAARYLLGAQNRDGGFGGAPGDESKHGFTGWAALGLAATGRNPADVSSGGRSTIDYIRSRVRSFDEPTDYALAILTLEAAGVSSRSFGGEDLVAQLQARRQGNGSYQGRINQTAYAIMALRAAGAGTSGQSVGWLESQQNRDGGFGYGSSGSSAEDTGYVLQALGAAGRSGSGTVSRALGFMEEAQRSNGGFSGGVPSANAQATAFAVQGIVAVGRDPGSFRENGQTPLGYLRSLQASDGHIRYSREHDVTPVWVTSQALLALEEQAFPIPSLPREGSGGGGGGGGAARGGGGAPGLGEAGAGSAEGAGSAAEKARAAERRAEERRDRRRARRREREREREREGVPGLEDSLEEESLPEEPAEAASDERGSKLAAGVAALSSGLFVAGARRRLRRRLAAATG